MMVSPTKTTPQKIEVCTTPIKKPRNAYILFSQSRRLDLVKDDPSMRIGDISKACAKIWNDMSDSEKEEWKAVAEKDKLRY